MSIPSMVSAAEQLLTALRSLSDNNNNPVTVTEQWPSREVTGSAIVLQEIGNSNTSVPVVDELSYQVDVWTEAAETTRSLFAQADEVMSGIGFHRTMLAPLSVDGFGWRQTGRYGRKVDKRTLRLID